MSIQNFLRSQIFQNILINNFSGIRSIVGYVGSVYNQVNRNRLEEVGPERLCAEWLLKNGGYVAFKELPQTIYHNYHDLPQSEFQKYHINLVCAKNSSINKMGLDHFKGCNHIHTVILHNCYNLEEDGLSRLNHLNKTLRNLQISTCDNLTEKSFDSVGHLTNLKSLILFDLPNVTRPEKLVKNLRNQLPGCLVQLYYE